VLQKQMDDMVVAKNFAHQRNKRVFNEAETLIAELEERTRSAEAGTRFALAGPAASQFRMEARISAQDNVNQPSREEEFF
jgi:hypothetical protein